MSFICKINNLGIKSFAQAINSCCKLGEDIYLDATPAKLTIRVLNEPYRSAFMLISFDNEFFESYEVDGRPTDNVSMFQDSQSNANNSVNNRDVKVTCKLKTRSCLLAFKKEKTLAKNLDYCEIKIQSNKDVAQFKFTYNSKCVKTMDLPLGGDGLGDVNDDIFQKGKHKVTCKTRILSDILTYFAKEDEYVTMKAMPQSIEFETHFVERDKSGKLTKTNIDIDEFDAYNVSDEVFLTFSLRLIRPFLSFCSSRIPEIDISMDGSNQPICFNAEFPPHTKISLALATLDVNHPNATRNSSRSSVMYQTTRSQQMEEVTDNATRRARLSSQHSRQSISNSQSSRHSQSSWNQADQDLVDERVISNEEHHTSRVSNNNEENSQIIPPTPTGDTDDIDMMDDDDNLDLDGIDDQYVNQLTERSNSKASSSHNIQTNEIPPTFDYNPSISQFNITRNGPQPTSTPLPTNPPFGQPIQGDEYWMSLPITELEDESEDDLLVPATDDEEESSSEEDESF